VGDDSHFVSRQKLLGGDGSVRRAVVMVKQSGLFPPKFGATSSHVFTQSPQNVAVEPGIHSLACWHRCFALPQLLYRWRHQSGIFLIAPRNCPCECNRGCISFCVIYSHSKSDNFKCRSLTTIIERLIVIYAYTHTHTHKFTALQTERSRVRLPIVSLDFLIDLILPVALWPWGPISL
jgi:hypothetical protein